MWVTESNSMPKTNKCVDGPLHLSEWSGTPKERQIAMEVASSQHTGYYPVGLV